MASAFVNENAENAVLNVILTRPSEQDIITQLVTDDFYKVENKQIFAAVQAMYMEHKAIDLATLSAEMAERYGAGEKALTDYAIGLTTGFYDIWATKDHIQTLKSCSMRRHVYLIVNAAQKELEDDSNDTNGVLEKVRQQLRDTVITKHSWMPINDVMMETFLALDKRQKGEEPAMLTGLSGLDNTLAGFHPGEFTILGARPGVGKSAFGGFVALNAANSGFKVGICSREMTAVQYGTRIIARGSSVDPKKLRTGNLDADDWVQITDAIQLYSKANVSFIFTAKYIEDLRAEVQRKVDSGELDMLIVDYIQLMRTKQKIKEDWLRIAYISKMLKDMSTDFNISVIGLAQVGRASDGTMPTLAELRGSGDLEQDADNVIFLHRPTSDQDKYVHPAHRQMFPALKEQGLQYIAINVAKQRQGPIGVTPAIFNPGRMMYTMIQYEGPQQTSMLPEPEDTDDEE